MKQNRLNKIEKLKISLKPYDYYLERLRSIDPKSLEESDRFYLKNFGIYNHKLRPEKFILRVRVPAGRVSAEKFSSLVVLAHAAKSRMVLTSRAQLELHDLDFETAWSYMEEVEKIGLSSWQTYTDNIRNIVTDPLDGIGEDSVIEVYETILRMQSLFLKKREYTGTLPRKFNTAISGSIRNITPFCGNDIFFALAKKDGVFGFKTYVGGKNSAVAIDLDIFCQIGDVVELFGAAVKAYIDHGPRASRTKCRLFHLIEDIGIARFRSLVLQRYEKEPKSGGEPLFEKFENAKNSFRLKDGGVAFRYLSRFGELSYAQADEIVELCAKYGIEELRLGPDQNLYIPKLPEEVEFKGSFERYGGVTVCAGSKYCIYSLFDTKYESSRLALNRAEKLGVTVGFSGCLKGCARHALSDIGFVGIRTGLYGQKGERGVRLYIGAEYTEGRAVGRLILYAVPLRCINRMIDLILSLYEKSGYESFEEFSAEVINRYSREALAFWLLLNYNRLYIVKREGLMVPEPKKSDDEKSYFTNVLKAESFDFEEKIVELLEGEEEFPFREAIIYLEKASFAVR